jgi:hypothetical protein
MDTHGAPSMHMVHIPDIGTTSRDLLAVRVASPEFGLCRFMVFLLGNVIRVVYFTETRKRKGLSVLPDREK